MKIFHHFLIWAYVAVATCWVVTLAGQFVTHPVLSSTAAPTLDRKVFDPLASDTRLVGPTGNWHWKNLNRSQQALFRVFVYHANPQAQEIIRRVAPKADVGLYAETACGTTHSCTQIAPTWPWQEKRVHVQLYAPTFANSRVSQYVALHEIGHLVDFTLLNPAKRKLVQKTFAKSPLWQKCFVYIDPDTPTKPQCVKEQEIWAEEWALWATGEPTSFSAYHIPRLMSDDAFSALVLKVT